MTERISPCPREIEAQADELWANMRYDEAASLYRSLILIEPIQALGKYGTHGDEARLTYAERRALEAGERGDRCEHGLSWNNFFGRGYGCEECVK